MNKLVALFSICMVLISPLILIAPARAVEVLDPICQNVDPNNEPQICKGKVGAGDNPLYGPDGILTRAVKIISIVVGVAAVITIILGGIRFMTSMGDPAKVAQARMAIIYAGVGLVVAAVAQLFVAFVLSKV